MYFLLIILTSLGIVLAKNIAIPDTSMHDNTPDSVLTNLQALVLVVFVEGGSFIMGDTFGDGYDDQKPTHSVSIRSFYMSKYEVTQAQWREVMSSNPSYLTGDSLPVEQVSWYDAIEFCNKLSQREGLMPCYYVNGVNTTCDWSANGYRLPTEAEWEYAARGGNLSNGYRYSGSNELNSVAWYWDNSNERTHNVGQKRSNELGLHDLSGNVREWCWDWYSKSYYQNSTNINPRGVNSIGLKSIRGCSWDSSESEAIGKCCPVYYRDYGYSPDKKFKDIGLRLVRAFQ